MSKMQHTLPVVVQTVDDQAFLAEPLLLPEYASLGDTPAEACKNLSRLLEKTLAEEPLANRCRRQRVDQPQLDQLTVAIKSHRDTRSWDEPIELTIHVLRYRLEQPAGPAYWVVRVPWLDLEICSRREEEWEELCRKEILRCLARRGATRDLHQLVQQHRISQLELREIQVGVEYPSALKIFQQNNFTHKTQVLKEATRRLNSYQLPPAYERTAEVEKIAAALLASPRNGVLLVGPSGVGKTAVIYELAILRHKLGLKDHPFHETNGSRLIAGQTGFGMWQERCQQLVEEAAEAKIVLVMGGLLELAEVGKSLSVQQGVADFLRPHIAKGKLAVICECTPEQWSILEKNHASLLNAFTRIDIEEPDPNSLNTMLQQKARELKLKKKVSFTEQALDLTQRLHRRFAAYSALPGRPMRFIEHLAMDGEAGSVVEETHIYQRFSVATGLPRFILDSAIPLSLPDLRRFFHDSVLGQEPAVERVIDMLSTVKAQLNRPAKPICSYLFIGPTGVGKTELAKAIAQSLFGDAQRLTRFDMSEFADPQAVVSLTERPNGEMGRLTSAVREQPFSVLLFDEFEKAHASFFDLLLQILGEARLTDGKGRLASFKTSVIIMTSNLGAVSFERGRVGAVQNQVDGHIDAHFTREVRDFLRPEIYNRIDAIVPFFALTPELVASIARLELKKLRRRAGIQERGLTLQVSESALSELARLGFNPKLGARPLKRALDQYLTLPLAERLAGW